MLQQIRFESNAIQVQFGNPLELSDTIFKIKSRLLMLLFSTPMAASLQPGRQTKSEKIKGL